MSALGAVAGYESVGPKGISCSPSSIQVLGPDGTSVQALTLGSVPPTVFFTSGGRSGGLPVSVSVCPITAGADLVDQGYTVRFEYNDNTGDSSSKPVTIGGHTFGEQDDKYGGCSLQGFVGHYCSSAGAGGAAPADEARAIWMG